MSSHKMIQIDADKKLTDDITYYTKLINDLSREVRLTSTKGLTKDLINGYSILNGGKHFPGHGSQNYLVFQPVFEYFKWFTKSSRTIAWNPICLSAVNIKSLDRSNSLEPGLNCISNAKTQVKVNGSCLKQ